MRYMTVGSGSAVPQKRRSAPCHLVRDGDLVIVVDLGPGSIWGLLRHGGVSLTEIGLILFTHLHMDHCADLAPLLFALRSRELARTEPMLILGPRGLREHYDKICAVWEHRVEPNGFELVIEEWSQDVFSWRGFTINAAPTEHSTPNIAWRIDPADPHCGIVITGDGQATDDLIALASTADHVLAAECAAGAIDVVEGHMNASQAGSLATACGSRMLILSHLNPGAETADILREAMSGYEGEVVVAEDGMEIEI